jgi:hypothetical protein
VSRVRAAWLVLLVAAAGLAIGCAAVAVADTAPHRVTVNATIAAPGDTVRVAGRWTLPTVTDGRGPIDSVRVTVTRTSPTPQTVVTLTLPASATVGAVAIPSGLTLVGTSSGTYCVASLRRSVASTPVCVPWAAVWSDVPPPPPGGVVLDTIRVLALLAKPDTATVLFAGTQRFCAFARMSDGKVRAVTYADGTSSLDVPACVAGYAAWFPMQERTPVLELARFRDPFGQWQRVRVA